MTRYMPWCGRFRPAGGHLRPARPDDGSPRASRAVGYAMAACTDSAIPCHRVMARDGVIREHAFGPGVQRAMLEAEGVPFTPDGRVDLARCPLGRSVTG